MPIELTPRTTKANDVAQERSDERPLAGALWRGARGRCPDCGQGAIFRAYLKVNDRCPSCRTELHHHRADDAPPYFVMMIVGHLIVGLVLAVEQWLAPPLWLHAAIFIPASIILALVLLPPVKGALIALQWALRMHGFNPDERAGHP